MNHLPLRKITNKIIKNYIQYRLPEITSIYWILGWYCTRPNPGRSGWVPRSHAAHTSGVTIKVTRHMLLHSRLEKNFPSYKWQLDKQHYRLDSMKCCRPGSLQDYQSQWIRRTLLGNGEQERHWACVTGPPALARWRLIEGDSVLQDLSITGKPGKPSTEEHCRTASTRKCKPHNHTWRRVGSKVKREGSLCLSLPSPQLYRTYFYQLKSSTNHYKTPREPWLMG